MCRQIYKNLRPSLAILTLLAMGACASSPNNEDDSDSILYEKVEYEQSESIFYKVQVNDRLGDISQEFTGSASNWRAIAAHNNIKNPKHLKVGAVLEIPGELLPKKEKRVQSVNTAAKTNYPETTSIPANTAVTVNKSRSEDNTEVVVSAIDSNRSFELNPIETETQTSVSRRSATTGNERYIKVVGSYYPKGVYAQPAAYSKLLLRVAPGTRFVLDQQVNDWFKIITDSGTGYIRMSDAELL